jgi:NADH dehydrogenase FAD-containing subunit
VATGVAVRYPAPRNGETLKIAVIGAGYVGIAMAVGLAEAIRLSPDIPNIPA